MRNVGLEFSGLLAMGAIVIRPVIIIFGRMLISDIDCTRLDHCEPLCEVSFATKPDLVVSPDTLHCNRSDAVEFSSQAKLDKRFASLMLWIE